MGSDESHVNVSLTVKDKVTRQCQQTTIFEEKGEPKLVRTEVPPPTSLTRLTARPNRLRRMKDVNDDDEVMLNVLRCQLTY